MVDQTRRSNQKDKRKLSVDEALIALCIAAMNANGHVGRRELARAHHLIWSTHRFRRKSGETVGRLIERMKELAEEEEPAALLERAAGAVPAALRPPAFAVIADLLLADGKVDARERRFLRQLAISCRIPVSTVATVIDAMLLKNRL